MTDFDRIYWLLDVRFDFLIPSFMEEYGIKKEDLVVVNSFHGRERENEGYGKIITLKSDKWRDKEGVVQEEPDDLNQLFVESENLIAQLNAGKKIFVAAFTGVGLPKHKNLVTLTSTGDIAKDINNKKKQIAFFRSIGISAPETTCYSDPEKLLKSKKLKKSKRAVLKPLFLSGGYRMKIVSSFEELEEYIKEIDWLDRNSEVLFSEYIEHDASYATMGIVGEDGIVHVFEVVDEQMLHNDVQYEGLLYPAQISSELKEKLLEATEKVGNGLRKKGYKGFFNVDFVEAYDGTPYAIEINARITFGTILVALLYQDKNIWKLLRGEAGDGKELPARISEPERKNSIVIGKLKAKEGSVYVDIPCQSDIQAWWKRDSNENYFKTGFIKNNETFLYGSYVGMFGRMFSRTEYHEIIINVFNKLMMPYYRMRKRVLFMYVENYCGFYNQGFNFSGDKKFGVTIENKDEWYLKELPRNNRIPDGFWGDSISDLRLFIGENGSGKTSILRLMCGWLELLSREKIPDDNGLILFEDCGEIRCITFMRGSFASGRIKNDGTIFFLEDWKTIKVFLDDIRVVYFSNTLERFDLGAEQRVIRNESLTDRLKRADREEAGDVIRNFRADVFSRQVILAERVGSAFPIHFVRMEAEEVPDDLEIMSDIWETLESWLEEAEPLSGEENRITGEVQKLVRKSLILASVGEYSKQLPGPRDFGAAIMAASRLGDSKARLYGFLGDIYNRIGKENAVLMEAEKADAALTGLKFENSSSQISENGVRRTECTVCLDANFYDFWESFSKIYTSNLAGRMMFSWDASVGERNKADLLQVLVGEIDKPQNIWCILDEPDNTFHPDWKRQVMKMFVDECNQQYSGRNVQGWITTHSPIMLSDVPGAAVSYLTIKNPLDGEKKLIENDLGDTFAQNIYTLFNDAFFLKEGVIGEFAGEKIIEVFTRLEKLERDLVYGNSKTLRLKENELEACKDFVRIISEPIIRHNLEMQIRRCERLLRNSKKGSNND